MVVCKYYQRGNCRYGQYCQFEHINNFGGNRRTDGAKNLAQVVAEEVHFAERGGQWLLSCFGPLKEKPCIPGMEDLSPEEVRWEMYQAQQNGMMEQAKMQYQKLCQDMKSKRDALKNPTRDVLLMLEKFETGGQNSGFNSGNMGTGKSSFTFATPQLGFPTSVANSNPFGNKFGTQNVFSNTFSSPGNVPMFGRATTSTFNTKPTFGSNAQFTTSNTSNSIFSGVKNTTSVFGETTSIGQTFNAISQQSNALFGGTTSQPSFGQPSVFGAATQATNVFAKPQVSQSVFGGGSTLFSGTSSQHPMSSLFGGAKTSTANPFSGGAATTLQATNSIFGGTTATETSTMTASTIFGQPKNTAAFGGTPVFGTTLSFSNNPSGTVFGGQVPFGTTPILNTSVFEGTNVSTPSFASITQNPAGGFHSSTIVTAPAVFPTTTDSTSSFRQNTNITPFASVASTISNPFVSSSSQFVTSNSTTVTSFPKPTFSTENTLRTQNNAPFGTVQNMTFANPTGSPFATTSTTVTSTVSNPFAPRSQQTNFPFGQPRNVTSTTTVTNDPFGKSSFGGNVMAIIDDSIYSLEGQLTDDERSMYLAEKFVLGKIPLKPPTKSIR